MDVAIYPETEFKPTPVYTRESSCQLTNTLIILNTLTKIYQPSSVKFTALGLLQQAFL